MRVVIAGAHGRIALLLGRLLAERGDEVVGIIRNPGHEQDLADAGVRAAVLDLESASVADVATVLTGADAVVFSAGAGPGSGAGRKDTVDRAASVLLADAAQAAGVRRFLQVSAMGVESVRGKSVPATADLDGDDVFTAYLIAKLAAEDDLRGRPLDWTILRPGGLTDEPGTSQVTLAPSVPPGSVSRADVAVVLLALLSAPAAVAKVLELVAGEDPIADAIATLR